MQLVRTFCIQRLPTTLRSAPLIRIFKTKHYLGQLLCHVLLVHTALHDHLQVQVVLKPHLCKDREQHLITNLVTASTSNTLTHCLLVYIFLLTVNLTNNA